MYVVWDRHAMLYETVSVTSLLSGVAWEGNANDIMMLSNSAQ